MSKEPVLNSSREIQDTYKLAFLEELRKYHKNTYGREVKDITIYLLEFPEYSNEAITMMGGIITALQKENLRYHLLPNYGYRDESREFQMQMAFTNISVYNDSNQHIVDFTINYLSTKVNIRYRNEIVQTVTLSNDTIYSVNLPEYLDAIFQNIKSIRKACIIED